MSTLRRRRLRQIEAYNFERTMPGPETVAVPADFVGSGFGDVQVPLTRDPGSVYQPYDSYGSDLNYTTETGMVGTMGDGSTRYTSDYPGAREHFSAEFADATEDELWPDAPPSVHDMIDYQVGGQMGLVNRFPYSTGAVSSDAEENFALTGEQIILRTDTYGRQLYGPVATSDSSAMLSLAYLQQQNMYYPNEASQADLVGSV